MSGLAGFSVLLGRRGLNIRYLADVAGLLGLGLKRYSMARCRIRHFSDGLLSRWDFMRWISS